MVQNNEYRLTEDIRAKKFWRAIFAEGLGVAMVVFVGCGSMLVGNYDSHPHYEPMDEPAKNKLFASGKIIRVAFAFGLAVATATWNLFHMSGAHLNPAITFGMLAAGRVSLVRAIFYCLGQLLGAVVGAGFIRLCLPDDYRAKLGSTVLGPDVEPGRGAVIELVATFVVVFTYFASTDKYRADLNGSAPLSIGLAVLACHLIAFPLTTCSLNPARSFGPALVGNFWDSHWIYWVGPTVGALSAALLYKLVFTGEAIRRDYTTMTTTECPLIITTAPDDLPRQDPFASPTNEPLLSTVVQVARQQEEARACPVAVRLSRYPEQKDGGQLTKEQEAAAASSPPATPFVEIVLSETAIPPPPQPEIFIKVQPPESLLEVATDAALITTTTTDERQLQQSSSTDDKPATIVAEVEMEMAAHHRPDTPAPMSPALSAPISPIVGASPVTTVIASGTAIHYCSPSSTPKVQERTPNGQQQQIVQIAVDID